MSQLSNSSVQDDGSQPTHAQRTRSGLDAILMRGVVWTSLGRWLFQGLHWFVSLVIARLLSPEDYGIAGMALVYIGLVQLASELGIGAALIQRRDVEEVTVSRLYGLTLSLGVGFAALSVPVGLAMAAFYREPRVFPVVAVYGLNFIAAGLRSLPNSLLTRDFRFKALAAITLMDGLVASVVSLVLAFQGFGYWALVLGNTCAAWLTMAVTWWLRPVRPRLPLIGHQHRGLLRFGLNLTAGRLAWYTYSNADFVLVGRLLGATQLGYYTLAWQLATIPLERIAGAVTQVLFPVFSAVRDNDKELTRYFRGLLEVLTLIMLPVTLGMALVAPHVFGVVLGPKWSPSVVPFALLALASNSRLVSHLAQQVLLAKGDARFPARCSAVAAVVMPAVILVVAPFGINAVAAAWVAIHPVLLLAPLLIKLRRVTRIPISEVFGGVLPGAAATVLMGGVVATLSLLFEAPSIRSLTVLVGVGMLTYGSALALFHRNRLRELAGLASRTRAVSVST